ncbi:natural resistance-associated macrophage protein [Diplogelasinospora grovesii]|uniref:Natural resistance-associated macrophage protein n=1 Tax=Diplogelasinospora grovesii TaxID=303347 RepID=A0AAN6S9M5_9PEZI|nr:natural resistance-associated macrophage protein [Diplogelasinospora grovesii]
MNRPSRTDEPLEGDGYNQSPNQFSNDLTTNEDLNGISNSRALRREQALSILNSGQDDQEGGTAANREDGNNGHNDKDAGAVRIDTTGPTISQNVSFPPGTYLPASGRQTAAFAPGGDPENNGVSSALSRYQRLKHAIFTFGKFVGPGFMVAVAYIDPGNYATDVAAGASYQFRLLFIVLMSNIFAIFLQSLSIKLGTVSGLNLAEACRAFLPRWLNYTLYVLAEAAIIATDIAEVIGTAIAINLLIPQIPLVAGCALSILDVMIILLFYQPNGSMRGLRAFEFFVILLVLGVVVCFCIQLSLIQNTSVAEVFKGYLPSSALVEQQALYQACGILGATVMPHSLYLGSGIVQARLRDYDTQSGLLPPEPAPPQSSASSAINEGGMSSRGSIKATYIPSLKAIRHSLKYSIAELTLSLFTFALFVNSAILIVAGAALYDNESAINADLFGIYQLLSASIAPAAGTIFALALLLSGISAGIVCTIAGQMVGEGALNWTLKPWLRRLITRSISITPSIIIAGAVGREGLDAALNGSQVALSIVLPFVTAPLIYFTCLNRYMTVRPGMARYGIPAGAGSTEEVNHGILPGTMSVGQNGNSSRGMVRRVGRWFKTQNEAEEGAVKMANSWYVAAFGVLVWVVITAMNLANLVLLGRGT